MLREHHGLRTQCYLQRGLEHTHPEPGPGISSQRNALTCIEVWAEAFNLASNFPLHARVGRQEQGIPHAAQRLLRFQLMDSRFRVWDSGSDLEFGIWGVGIQRIDLNFTA
jgi:hypothetical protein